MSGKSAATPFSSQAAEGAAPHTAPAPGASAQDSARGAGGATAGSGWVEGQADDDDIVYWQGLGDLATD